MYFHIQSITSAKFFAYSLTFSAGETISIADFNHPNGVSLSSGFIQNTPLIVTGLDEINARFGVNEIKITPNPIQNKTILYFDINGFGQLQYQILDIVSNVLFKSSSMPIFNNAQKEIDISNFTSGQYFIQVFYKSSNGFSKVGIFKIIKL